MRYVDITYNDITQNVLAMDLEFITSSENTIKLNERHNNLSGVSNLSDAMDILDTFSGASDTNIKITNSNGVSEEVSNIIVDDYEVTGTREVTLINSSLDRTIQNINTNNAIYEGVSAKIHNFEHNLDSEFLNIDVWVKEEVGWQNSIVPITILDNNHLKVELSTAKQIRIIIKNVQDITKTYGL